MVEYELEAIQGGIGHVEARQGLGPQGAEELAARAHCQGWGGRTTVSPSSIIPLDHLEHTLRDLVIEISGGQLQSIKPKQQGPHFSVSPSLPPSLGVAPAPTC